MRESRLHLNCAPDTAASDWTPTSGHAPCPGRRQYRQPPLMRPPKKRKKETFQACKEEDDATAWVTRQIVVNPVLERKCQSR